jgi:hypothetical protein
MKYHMKTSPFFAMGIEIRGALILDEEKDRIDLMSCRIFNDLKKLMPVYQKYQERTMSTLSEF